MKIKIEGFEEFKKWAEDHGAYDERQMREVYSEAFMASFFADDNNPSVEIWPTKLHGARTRGEGDIYIVRVEDERQGQEGEFEFEY